MFSLAKMSQDSIDDVLVLNTGNDLYRSSAMTANLDIDVDSRREPTGVHATVGFSGVPTVHQ
ncbi:hypothetical protein [Halioglobus sp. Uisw_031]|uniref:hypothetical protein n=1 Tax=Halioglobus sp. Uisw_031 TaxID=3230977 RepID=UPI0039EBF63C